MEAWPCPRPLWEEVQVLAKEVVVGGTSGATAPWGWGKSEPGPGRASQGPGQGQLSRTVCPWRGQGGCHSEHAVCQSLGPGRSACWLHPEPAPRDAGGGSQDQSRRLCAPLPQQQGTKVGQGGRRGPRRAGGGAQGAQKAPRGRGPGEDAWKSKTMCAVSLGGARAEQCRTWGFSKSLQK